MATSKNIIVGAARIFIGPALSLDTTTPIATRVGTWRPAFAAGTKYGTTLDGDANWRDVGYTQDGLTITTDPTWDNVEVDQLLDAAKIFKSGMTVTIATTFAEATLENLLVAWGQASGSASSVGAGETEAGIEAGALGAAPQERGLIAIGNAVEKSGSNAYGERVYSAYRVLSVDSVASTMARADATTIPVSFRALPADDARYGTVRDRLNV